MSDKAERRSSGGSATGGDATRDLGDFVDLPAYRSTLHLCRVVMDLETEFPDDDRQLIYVGLKRAVLETGALIASAFGRSEGRARVETLEEARSKLMECRHYALVAGLRYHLDSAQSRAFEEEYFEILAGLNELIGPVLDAASGRAGRRS